MLIINHTYQQPSASSNLQCFFAGRAVIGPADTRLVGMAFSTSHLSCFQSASSGQTKRRPHGPMQYMWLDRNPKNRVWARVQCGRVPLHSGVAVRARCNEYV